MGGAAARYNITHRLRNRQDGSVALRIAEPSTGLTVGGSTALRNMKTINLLTILTLTLTLTRYKRLQFEKNVKMV